MQGIAYMGAEVQRPSRDQLWQEDALPSAAGMEGGGVPEPWGQRHLLEAGWKLEGSSKAARNRAGQGNGETNTLVWKSEKCILLRLRPQDQDS